MNARSPDAAMDHHYVHGSGCAAETSGLRRDCTCNLREPEYDGAWVSIEKLRAVQSGVKEALRYV